MLRKISLLMLVLSTLVWMSCSNLFTIQVGTAFEQDFPVSLDSSQNSIATNAVIDISANSDLEQYKNKIEKYTIKSVKIKVLSYDGSPDALVNGTLQYSDPAIATGTTFATMTDLNINNLFVSGEEQTLDVTTTELENLAQMFLDTDKAKVYVVGTVSNTPIVATIKVIIDVEARVQVVE